LAVQLYCLPCLSTQGKMYGTLRKNLSVSQSKSEFMTLKSQLQLLYFLKVSTRLFSIQNKNSGYLVLQNQTTTRFSHHLPLLAGRACPPACTAVRLGRQRPVTRARMPVPRTCTAARLLRLTPLTGACNNILERGNPACSWLVVCVGRSAVCQRL
jgi:hypothetical protein